MKQYGSVKWLGTWLLAAVMALSAPFCAQAAAVPSQNVPVTLHMDVNSRQTAVYNGYTSYVMGNRASEYDTFTITRDSGDISLDDVTMNYYLITYDGDSQKYLECTVHGLKEGVNYPVVSPETVSREAASGGLYDRLERCYVVEFCYGDDREEIYFTLLPEEDMQKYRNILLGKWEKDAKGWRYLYQGGYLTSWAQINERWYLFGTDGYMKTGWQEYKGQWYYLNPSDGVMRSSCTIDGYELDASGARR